MAMEMLEMEMVGATSPCGSAATAAAASDDEADLKRGPWTVEEDVLLVNHIAAHGEGRWNSLAQSAGLKRTGKSCRLRWLNYLRPDVRRGNITEEEQLLILELHSRWGNRWSKIAQHLPGRTDNEIKNYWRTRVQKHAKQLKCDVNSKQFRDVMRYLWMPRLVERIQADSAAAAAAAVESPVVVSSPIAGGLRPPPITVYQTGTCNAPSQATTSMSPDASSVFGSSSSSESSVEPQFTSNPVISDGVAGWSSSMQCGVTSTLGDSDVIHDDILSGSWSELLAAADGSGFTGCFTGLPDLELGEFGDNLWSLEDILLQC